VLQTKGKKTFYFLRKRKTQKGGENPRASCQQSDCHVREREANAEGFFQKTFSREVLAGRVSPLTGRQSWRGAEGIPKEEFRRSTGGFRLPKAGGEPPRGKVLMGAILKRTNLRNGRLAEGESPLFGAGGVLTPEVGCARKSSL